MAILYQERGFINIKTVSFHVEELNILNCLSGRPARNIFYICLNFIVSHFISFNCKLLLNKPRITETKGTIQSVSTDLMTSVLPDWLIPPLLFFLYIFAIPPGWFGRISKPLHRGSTIVLAGCGIWLFFVVILGT